MSFSADVKEELNNNLSLKNKEFLKAELLGYLISNNATINKGKKYSNISYVTENEFNIEIKSVKYFIYGFILFIYVEDNLE